MTPSSRASILALFSLLASCSSCTRSPPDPAAADAAPAASSSAPVATSAPAPASASSAASARPDEIPLAPLSPDAPFQGRLTVRVLGGANADDPEGVGATYRFTVKGAKSRWDLFSSHGRGAPTGLRVYDADQHKFFTVMTQRFVYVTDESRLGGDAGAPVAWKLQPFTDQPKGRVLDVPCDRVHAEDDRNEYEVCLASGIAVLPLHLLGAEMASTVPFGAQLEEKRLFPMTVLVRGLKPPPGGLTRPIVGKLTVESVERGVVPDEIFALPNYPVQEAATLAISTHLLH